MFTKRIGQYALPAVAAGLFVFAIVSTVRPQGRDAVLAAQPPTSPYETTVAGIGVVEPESEMIAIATDLPGVVREVMVTPGSEVEKNAPLFRLDDRAVRAALAKASAGVDVALAARDDERSRLKLYQSIDDQRAVSIDEMSRRNFAAQAAEAALAQARAEKQAIETDLDRLVVRAPIAGRVYSVNVRVGEFAATGNNAEPLVTMGADRVLHVRAEFDEILIPDLQTGAPATGVLRGRAEKDIPLTFVRFEPQAVEKRTLAGGSERVNTRVVEAIYAFDPALAHGFVGQRMDVFVKTKARDTTQGDS